MGERWEPFEAYNLDRARTPSVQAALATLMERFGDAGDPTGGPGTDRYSHDPDLGRHDLATPLSVAEAASARYGWPLHVIENCQRRPSGRAARSAAARVARRARQRLTLEQRRQP